MASLPLGSGECPDPPLGLLLTPAQQAWEVMPHYCWVAVAVQVPQYGGGGGDLKCPLQPVEGGIQAPDGCGCLGFFQKSQNYSDN